MLDVKICSCGRIHMIPESKLDNALDNEKNLLLICGGCGAATVIGADIEPDFDEPDKMCYNMYSYDFTTNENKSITKDNFDSAEDKKGIAEIFYSKGVKVPMKNGSYATNYSCEIFSDTWYPDFYKIQRKNVTVEEIMKFIDDYNKDRTTVDMQRFINEAPEELLEYLSGCLSEAFDWSGTKYEKKC